MNLGAMNIFKYWIFSLISPPSFIYYSSIFIHQCYAYEFTLSILLFSNIFDIFNLFLFHMNPKKKSLQKFPWFW